MKKISTLLVFAAAPVLAQTAPSAPAAPSNGTTPAPAANSAPAAAPQNPQTIVIGLKTWTWDKVNDALVKKFGPSEGLNSHACGANIADLGFPRTSAIYFRMKDGSTQIIVGIVEPGDTSHIKANSFAPVSKPLPAAWDSVLRAFHIESKGKIYLRTNELSNALRLYTLVEKGLTDSARTLAPRAKLTEGQMKIWDLLLAQKSAEDKARALSILTTDSSYMHRAMAVAMLANFGATDDTWHALLHAIRDPNHNVANAASTVLSTFTSTHKRKVDWAPAASDIRALLAGSNLWELPGVMGILVRSEIDPSLAGKVLKDNGIYVLGYANVNNVQSAHAPARKLLAQLSGADHGADVAKWESWVASL